MSIEILNSNKKKINKRGEPELISLFIYLSIVRKKNEKCLNRRSTAIK
jgi:hypothetical protein